MNSATFSNRASTDTTRQANLVVRHPIASVIALMFVLVWAGLLPDALASQGLFPFHLPLPVQLAVGLMPAVAAIAVAGVVDGRKGIRELLARLLIVRVGLPWYLVALFAIAAFILGGIGLFVLFSGTLPVIPLLGVPLPTAILAFAVSMVLSFVFNTEEIAWRGFILPRLQRNHTALMASLMIAVPEALFHLPYFLNKDVAFYQNVGILAFSALTIAETIIFTWVFNNTRGSLFVVTLMHASQNTWANLLSDNQAGPFFWTVVIAWVCALLVLVVFGAKRLARHPVAPATGIAN